MAESVTVVEQAARVLAGLSSTTVHSQFCPVYAFKRPISECDCWILRNARGSAEALDIAELLAQDT